MVLDDKINKTILKKLNTLEQFYQIKILFAIESGSRGWGFESADSDYDCRFVYVHNRDWYLQVHKGRDVVELPVDAVLDISGWDLKKSLQLLYKTNMPLTEWLTTPIVYREVPEIRQKMLSLAKDYFSPISAMHHYLNMARKNYDTLDTGTIRIKKFFYTLRPVLACMYIDKYNQIPPMNIHVLMQTLDIDDAILKEINALITFKKSCTEADTIALPFALKKYIDDTYVTHLEMVKSIKHHKNYDKEHLDAFFLEILKKGV